MPVFYSNHLCVVEVRGGQQPAERVEGRRKDRIALGESLRRAEWEVLAATAKPHAACVIVALLPAHAPPNSQKHLHARHLTSVTFELLRTVRTRSGERRQTETKEKKAQQTSSSGLSLALTSPSLVCISDELQIEIIKAHLSLWPVTICVSNECFLWYLTIIIHTGFSITNALRRQVYSQCALIYDT